MVVDLMWIIRPLNRTHVAPSRPLPGCGLQSVEGPLVTSCHDLDPPIWQVGHPTVEAERLGLPKHVPPEAHTLDSAADQPSIGRQG